MAFSVNESKAKLYDQGECSPSTGSLGRIERRKTRWHIEGKAMKRILVSRTPGILIRAAYLNTSDILEERRLLEY